MILFVFLTKRPNDKQAWPLVYQSLELALDAPHRVSAVHQVDVPEYAKHPSVGKSEEQK
jgi:hypothetical protein